MAAVLTPPADLLPAPPGPTAARPATARPATARPATARPATANPTTANPVTAEAVTAAPRDVFVDATRALATVGIVSAHWLMPEATYDGHTLWVGNALSHGWAWVLTWAFQVLPLLFFAAGASGAYQHARLAPAPTGRARAGRGWAAVVAARLRGVARPVTVFALAWALALGVLAASPLPGQPVMRLARMAPQLLWFLAVWAGLVALTPVARAAWRRWRWAALGVVVAAPLLVDVVRFGAGLPVAGWANVLLVWAVPFLLGVAYADDAARRGRAGRAGRADRPADAPDHGPRTLPLVTTRRLRRRARRGELVRRARRRALTVDALPRPLLVAVAVAATAAMAGLVAVGPYPASTVGMPGAAISNLAPPTALIVAQSVAQVALVLLARTALTRWARGRGRGVVRLLTRHSMTVYLWHLTAMFVVVGAVLLVLHERLPEPWTADWWSTRPVWWGAFALVLTALVTVFGRFEASRGAGARRPGGRGRYIP